MAKFSKTSKERLATCDERLQRVLDEAIKYVDFTVLEGHRSNARQQEMFNLRLSKATPGKSKHNAMPSLAVDIAPYPIDWKDRERFLAVVFFIKGIASQMGIELRLGADWNGNFNTIDQSFHDLPHIELVV